MRHIVIVIASAIVLSTGARNVTDVAIKETPIFAVEANDSLTLPGEVHLRNTRKLTDGGDNAEVYWSFDDTKLIFQANVDKWGTWCDQIFLYDLAGIDGNSIQSPMVSTGRGRTTYSYFLPGNGRVIHASTHHHVDTCPPVTVRRNADKYIWPICAAYDLFISGVDGTDLIHLTHFEGYDAEATRDHRSGTRSCLLPCVRVIRRSLSWTSMVKMLCR